MDKHKELERLLIGGRPKLYTYQEIGELLGVRASTIRKWKSAGEFRIIGYRRISRFHKEAVVSPYEVLKLISKKILGEGMIDDRC